jgi:hypothetical protein
MAIVALLLPVFCVSCATIAGSSDNEERPQATDLEPVEPSQIARPVQETPLIMLLDVPVSSPEPASFGMLPEPVPIHANVPAREKPSLVHEELAYIAHSAESAFIYRERLPEPEIPVAEAPADDTSDITASFAKAHPDDLPYPAALPQISSPAAPSHEWSTFVEDLGSPPAAAETSVINRDTAKTSVVPPAAAESSAIPPGAVESPWLPQAAEKKPAAAPVFAERPAAEAQTDNNAFEKIALRKADNLFLSFDGRGWIFTSGGTGEHAVSLLSRTITADETLFELSAPAVGEYILEFQFQDNRSGTMSVERVALVVSEEVDASGAAEKALEMTETPLTGVPVNLAEAIEDPVAATMVLGQILSTIKPEDKVELQRITELYKNIGSTNEYAMCLERFIEIFPDSSGNDFRYFELGTLYESDELRNEKKARQYYAAILERYPASVFYLDAAARVRYLDRHFFDVR